MPYDALLVVSFGGPERSEDVLPFLESVCRGKNVPPARLEAVAEHYDALGGVSPLGAQLRALLAATINELASHGLPLAVYWGNRHWHPLLADTLREMADDGITRALALVTSPFGSHASCRQYREDIERARAEVGPAAPVVDKLRLFYNHPGFIEAVADRVAAAIARLPEAQREQAALLFTAHSLPLAMARGCPYVSQLRQSCSLVAERLSRAAWELVYQSRSGGPGQEWLEPDVGDFLLRRHERGDRGPVVVAPIGFLVEHMETVYDLDVELAALCQRLETPMVRSATPGCHPRLVRMIRELLQERLLPDAPRLALGPDGPWPDDCPADCCARRQRG